MNEQGERPFLSPGMVALVGAGPGDPDLLTVGAIKALREAEVVVYDALVSPEVMAQIPPACELVYAGKRGGSASASQEDICALLVRLARQGKRVVRLKGGDPFVFGRGGEEAVWLAEEGIPFRVVPGLSSGIAGPAYAGIPVTHRSINAHVAFITGHESAAVEESRIPWEVVGQTFPVLVLYMAMKNLGWVVERLLAGGRDPGTPVAVIRWATTPRQQTLVTTLQRVVDEVEACKVEPPTVIVVGEVVAFRRQLAWFADETLHPPS